MGFINPPSPPAPAPPPPTPPIKPSDPWMEEDLRKREEKRYGREKTIVTGPLGLVGNEETSKRTLLGDYISGKDDK